MDKALTIFRKNNNMLGIANVYLTLSEMSLIDGSGNITNCLLF